MTFMMAIDQYGQAIHGLDAKHPRKSLLTHTGFKSASKMYIDKVNGPPRHVGYIVGGRWFTLYTVTPFEKEA